MIMEHSSCVSSILKTLDILHQTSAITPSSSSDDTWILPSGTIPEVRRSSTSNETDKTPATSHVVPTVSLPNAEK